MSGGPGAQNVDVAGVDDPVHGGLKGAAVLVQGYLPQIFNIRLQNAAQHVLSVNALRRLDPLGGGQAACNAFCMDGYPSYPSSAANRTTVDSLTSVSLPSLLAVMKAAWS